MLVLRGFRGFRDVAIRKIRSDPFVSPEQLRELWETLYRDACDGGARWLDVQAYVLLRDGLVCRICGLPIRAGKQHVDHILPRSMGGTDDPANLRVTHPFCNNSRGPHVGRSRCTVLHEDREVAERHRRSIAAARRAQGTRNAYLWRATLEALP